MIPLGLSRTAFGLSVGKRELSDRSRDGLTVCAGRSDAGSLRRGRPLGIYRSGLLRGFVWVSLSPSLFGHTLSVYPLMIVGARGSRPSRTFVLTLWNERVLFSLSPPLGLRSLCRHNATKEGGLGRVFDVIRIAPTPTRSLYARLGSMGREKPKVSTVQGCNLIPAFY